MDQYEHMAKVFDLLREHFPERPLSPPEPTEEQQRDIEERELLARDEFDEMQKPALDFVIDCDDLLHAILKAAVTRDVWGGKQANDMHQMELVRAIDAAREDYVDARLAGRV